MRWREGLCTFQYFLLPQASFPVPGPGGNWIWSCLFGSPVPCLRNCPGTAKSPSFSMAALQVQRRLLEQAGPLGSAGAGSRVLDGGKDVAEE